VKTAAPALVRLEDVGRSYRMGTGELEALRGVSMSVERGEYLALMGPSGSGKSTLMHVAGCLDRPTRGRCWLDGSPLEELSDEALSELRNRRIGFVFQSFHLIPQLSILENVEVPLVYAGVPRAERSERAKEMLGAVGLGGRLRHRPNELSGGECQRVAIARALVGRPDLVLADEPTGNLDRRTGEEILELLEGLQRQGVTVVLVTHDLEKAARARRVLRMEDGRIVGEHAGTDPAALLRELETAARHAPIAG
jgi:putative ABC transport system ATP-binding protein